jgi:serine phosphatase RsbU (regulator of sigma subunit)
MGILALAVAFLTVSAVVLLKKDKRAYVYDAQATACALTGREFAGYAQSTVDIVRQALVMVDPFKPVPKDAQERLQFLLNTQSVTLSVHVGRYRSGINEFIPFVKASRSEIIQKLGLAEEELNLFSLALKHYQATLIKKGTAFVNLSRVGKPPLLGIVLLDRQINAGEDAGLAVGTISLQAFQSGIPPTVGSLAIFGEDGDILFHNDSSTLVKASAMQAVLDNFGARDPVFKEASQSKANSGAKEVSIDGSSYLASFYKPGLGLIVATRIETAQAMLATYTLIEKLLLFGLFSISLATILAILFGKSMTKPLNTLYEATKQVGQGNFDVKIRVTGKDEIGALSHAFGAMSQRIAELLRKMVDQVRMEQEIAVASSVQSNLFPPPIYADPQIKLRGFYKSASECGGDWYDFFRVGNRLIVVIADATGHGIPSALMTASIRGCFSAIQRIIRSKPNALKLTPKEILPIANTAVFQSGKTGINMTFFISIIDFEKKTITYANAAHCPPWLVRSGGGKPAKARILLSAGPRLGEGPEYPDIEEFTMPLEPNDLLLFFTDGLLEGKNADGAMYGKKRARNVLEANYGHSEEHVLNVLVKDFMDHNGDKALDDDLTLVAVAINPDAFKNIQPSSESTRIPPPGAPATA